MLYMLESHTGVGTSQFGITTWVHVGSKKIHFFGHPHIISYLYYIFRGIGQAGCFSFRAA